MNQFTIFLIRSLPAILGRWEDAKISLRRSRKFARRFNQIDWLQKYHALNTLYWESEVEHYEKLIDRIMKWISEEPLHK